MFLIRTRNGMKFAAYAEMLTWLETNALASYRFMRDSRTIAADVEHERYLQSNANWARGDAYLKTGRRNTWFAVTDQSVAEELKARSPRDVTCEVIAGT